MRGIVVESLGFYWNARRGTWVSDLNRATVYRNEKGARRADTPGGGPRNFLRARAEDDRVELV